MVSRSYGCALELPLEEFSPIQRGATCLTNWRMRGNEPQIITRFASTVLGRRELELVIFVDVDLTRIER